MTEKLTVIGGGLAGSEAAWQAAQRGTRVELFEMRPSRMTEVHRTIFLGELVCSNSLRSLDPLSAPGLLKKELISANSLIMDAAMASSVPAGAALAVDRERFAGHITTRLSSHPLIQITREEVTSLPEVPAILATGPLTSAPMAESISRAVGSASLYFYDAIAPIVSNDSIDMRKIFRASRYGKGGEDYLNCPFTEDEYMKFFTALVDADRMTPRSYEEEKVFEGCMPIEVMAARGKDTLRYGPMKPVGLLNPSTGRVPYAVVQLRAENIGKTAFNLVGFQTRLKRPEQNRVFRLIPGLENAEFLRYGSMHRNTFINSPACLCVDLSLKTRNSLFVAGQISGVEGYIESTAMGLIAGINASLRILGKAVPPVPLTTAHGALIHYITGYNSSDFQPSNINFGLLPVPGGAERIRDRKRKRQLIVTKALEDWENYLAAVEDTFRDKAH